VLGFHRTRVLDEPTVAPLVLPCIYT
jgi:hypothetical protein